MEFFFFSNLFLNYFPNTEKCSDKYQGVNIDQSAMCYMSMDSSQEALQTDGKLFSNFKIIFQIEYNF